MFAEEERQHQVDSKEEDIIIEDEVPPNPPTPQQNQMEQLIGMQAQMFGELLNRLPK